MNIALTVVTVLFGAYFLAGGAGRLLGRGPVLTPGSAWFSVRARRVIGSLEMLGGAGLLAAPVRPVAGFAAALFLYPLTAVAFFRRDWHQEHVLRLAAAAASAYVLLCVAAGIYAVRMR